MQLILLPSNIFLMVINKVVMQGDLIRRKDEVRREATANFDDLRCCLFLPSQPSDSIRLRNVNLPNWKKPISGFDWELHSNLVG